MSTYFTATGLNVTVLALYRVKNILAITEPIITTLSDPVLIVRRPKLTEGFLAYFKKYSTVNPSVTWFARL